MTDQPSDPTAIGLFLKADEKIEIVRQRAEHLMTQDLKLDHKMDMVMQQQSALKERFEHTSMTGHKTWEATQRIEANIEKLTTRVILAEGAAQAATGTNEKMEKKFDKYVLGMIVTVFCTILLTIMTFLLKWKP